MKLQGKTAIVTGAASGLGREIAATYIREGARVAIADLNLEQATSTAEAIAKGAPAGAGAMAVKMDVTSEDEVNTGIAAVP